MVYSIYDTLKVKLRLPDDTLQPELEIYSNETDAMIDNRIRDRIGYVDSNGRNIVLPLTTQTLPTLDQELTAIANDLTEGKFRLKTAGEDLLWNEAVARLDVYLERKFGLKEGHAYRIIPTYTVSPLNGTQGVTVVTVTGTQWLPGGVITIYFNGVSPTTISPSQVLSDSFGNFSATFTVPTGLTTPYSYIISVTDSIKTLNNVRFTVTS